MATDRTSRTAITGRFLFLLAAALAAGVPILALASQPRTEQAASRFLELVPWLPEALPKPQAVLAFEEHAHFVYLAAEASPTKERDPGRDRDTIRTRYLFLRPGTLLVELFPPAPNKLGKPADTVELQRTLPGGRKIQRRFALYRAPGNDKEVGVQAEAESGTEVRLTVHGGGRRMRLVLPAEPDRSGRIAIESTDGTPLLPERRLPDGILPAGKQGRRLLARWDAAYQRDSKPPWDTGVPCIHLRTAVESGEIKPGRAVVLGCGTGTNALYLAGKGFDVTAIDIAPTALNLARTKAEKANRKVRWMLADVVAPPAGLAPFDFVYDRGCYHGVRRGNAKGYVEAVRRLSKPGAQLLVIAGNANEERHYGPPRVKEEDLRADFMADFDFLRLDTVRFGALDPQGKGALAWSVLLRTKQPE